MNNYISLLEVAKIRQSMDLDCELLFMPQGVRLTAMCYNPSLWDINNGASMMY
jgi:hypothetical protein